MPVLIALAIVVSKNTQGTIIQLASDLTVIYIAIANFKGGNINPG